MSKDRCGQCGKEAFGGLGGVPICFGCATAWQLAQNAAEANRLQLIPHNMAMMNQALDDADAVTRVAAYPASQLIASGMDVLTISRRMGHGSPSITLDVYGHHASD